MQGLSLFASAGIAEINLGKYINFVLGNELLPIRSRVYQYWHPQTAILKRTKANRTYKSKHTTKKPFQPLCPGYRILPWAAKVLSYFINPSEFYVEPFYVEPLKLALEKSAWPTRLTCNFWGGVLDVNVCSAVYFTINILLYILLLSLFYIFFLCRQKETKNSAHVTLS